MVVQPHNMRPPLTLKAAELTAGKPYASSKSAESSGLDCNRCRRRFFLAPDMKSMVGKVGMGCCRITSSSTLHRVCTCGGGDGKIRQWLSARRIVPRGHNSLTD